MNVADAILTRLSEPHLVDPAPSRAEFVDLLACAAHAPDHGRIQPWRWILVDGASRLLLGDAFATGRDATESLRAGALPLRAPVLATLVLCPQAHERIPVWEQLAAAVGVANALMLLLHNHGYASIWRTGRYCDSAAVRDALELAPSESLLGWLYIGTPDPARPRRRRAPISVADKVTVLHAAPPVARPGRPAHARLGRQRILPEPVEQLVGEAGVHAVSGTMTVPR